MDIVFGNLRNEEFINSSGVIKRYNSIEKLKEKNYFVKPHNLDGDAPKSFIKAYFYEKGSGVRKRNFNSWTSYIAKSAEKWYPHESIIEYMINRVGQVMGMVMNQVRLVEINGQLRFLSKYFRNKNEILVHGAEICGQHLNDRKFAKLIAENRGDSRDLFTFEFICEALQSVFPKCYNLLICDLVKMCAFDAISGNNDRHFYNWGVLDSALKSRKRPKFAPIYDSARGFVWNWSDDSIKKHLELRKNGGSKIDKYISNAAPRISFEDNKSANHFELINYLKRKDKKFNKIIMELASVENEKLVLKMLEAEFFPYFIKERNEIIELIVKERYQKVRDC